MLVPETDAYAALVRFGVPAAERRTARIVAIAVAAIGAGVWFAWEVPTGVRLLAVVCAGVISLEFAVHAWRSESVELDMVERTYARAAGFVPFLSRQTVGTASSVGLHYHATEQIRSEDGVPEHRYSAWLQMETKRLPLVLDWSEGNAVSYFALLAERMGAPLVALDQAPGRRRLARSVGSSVAWAGVITVFALMFWPVISGQRPFRLAWASTPRGRRAAPAPGFTMFQHGVEAYTAGKFADAESILMQSVSAGMDPGDAFNMIAYAQAAQKRLDDAMQSAQKALTYSPDSGNILDTVGEMHELRKEYAQAVDFYRKAVRRPELAPAVETNTKLGRSLLALGRRKEAISCLREAAQFRNSQFGPLAGRLLRSIGQPLPPPAHSGGFGSATRRAQT